MIYPEARRQSKKTCAVQLPGKSGAGGGGVGFSGHGAVAGAGSANCGFVQHLWRFPKIWKFMGNWMCMCIYFIRLKIGVHVLMNDDDDDDDDDLTVNWLWDECV